MTSDGGPCPLRCSRTRSLKSLPPTEDVKHVRQPVACHGLHLWDHAEELLTVWARRVLCPADAHAQLLPVVDSVVLAEHRLPQDEELRADGLVEVERHQHGQAAQVRAEGRRALRRELGLEGPAGSPGLAVVLGPQGKGGLLQLDVQERAVAAAVAGEGRLVPQALVDAPEGARRHREQGGARVHGRLARAVLAEGDDLVVDSDAADGHNPMALLRVEERAPREVFADVLAGPPAQRNLAVLPRAVRQKDTEGLRPTASQTSADKVLRHDLHEIELGGL
mmetsp:Transcript_34836/g.94356  ORF Transcript_34836/g.94356 Transcript_34836/m.94356 type:complete len:279 (+) Transcript_34836:52-888(+)